jgi:hypothetical protein
MLSWASCPVLWIKSIQTSEVIVFLRLFNVLSVCCWCRFDDFELYSSSVVIWIGLNEIGDCLLLSDKELFERELKADGIVLLPSIDDPLE